MDEQNVNPGMPSDARGSRDSLRPTGPYAHVTHIMGASGHKSRRKETTMALTINLPRHIREYLAREVAQGRFESEEAAIVDAVEHVMDNVRWEDDPELLAAIAEADRGAVYELTPELKRDIRRQSEENLRRGHRVRDDVTY